VTQLDYDFASQLPTLYIRILLYSIVRQDKYQNIEYLPMGCEEMHKDMKQLFGKCLERRERQIPSNNSSAMKHSCRIGKINPMSLRLVFKFS